MNVALVEISSFPLARKSLELVIVVFPGSAEEKTRILFFSWLHFSLF